MLRRELSAMSIAATLGCGSSPSMPSEGTTSGSMSTATETGTTEHPWPTDASSESSSSGSEESSSSTTDIESSSSTTGAPEVWEWDLPTGFPEPWVPDDNPMSAAKVELGRYLFYDTRMSGEGTFACASCHEQERAFTDGRVTAMGETGEIHRRNSMALTNVAYNASLTWAHPLMIELESQAVVPMFGVDPVELGIDSEKELVAALEAEPLYEELFAAAFPDEPGPITAAKVVYALSAFQRTMISGNSPFDRWFNEGDKDAISESAKRGYELFNGHPMECFHCHLGFNLTEAVYWRGKPERELFFHNTGLYNVDGEGAYPAEDQGLFEMTLEPADMGKFRAPSLRNVAVTSPYMHDGSIATLDEVLDHYAAGGRTITEGPNAGVGSESPVKNPIVAGFAITEQERADVIAFLESLTDEEFLGDPAFSSPW